MKKSYCTSIVCYLVLSLFLSLNQVQGQTIQKKSLKEAAGLKPEDQVDKLFTEWNNPEIPGAVVAIVKNGRIIYSKGYGSANLEYNIPNTPATVFHMASVSKQFTAFSILLLAKEGKLSLDDDIRKYIPEVPDFGKVITLRELAHHTSGLRDQWNLLAMAGWRMDDVITKENILNLVSKQKELNFDPGAEFSYCNTGFTLLAEVVSRVSGQTFAEFTKKHIFEPLKMTHTLFYDDHEKIVKNRAYSFYADGAGYKKSVLNYANVGATSLFSTAEDLSLWAMNFEAPVAWDKDFLKGMNERGILNSGDTITYAMGQDIGKYRGLLLISHGGADAGYRTYLGRFPDQRFSVIVLSNNAAFNPGGIAMKIADIYLKDYFPKENKKEVSETPVQDTSAVSVDKDMLQSYCGGYELQPGVIVRITLDNDRLYAEPPGSSRILLNAMSADKFRVKGMDVTLTFQKDDEGLVNKIMVDENGNVNNALRMKEFDAAAVNLSEFTGDYFSPELSTNYTFLFENGQLIARHFRTGDVKLSAIKPDTFSGNKWYFGQIEFKRDDKNNILGCRVSSGRVRNLWFEKVNK